MPILLLNTNRLYEHLSEGGSICVPNDSGGWEERGKDFIKIWPVVSCTLQTNSNASLFHNYCHCILLTKYLLGNTRGNNKQ